MYTFLDAISCISEIGGHLGHEIGGAHGQLGLLNMSTLGSTMPLHGLHLTSDAHAQNGGRLGGAKYDVCL